MATSHGLTAGATKLAKKASQAEIAKRLAVSQQAVSGWLTGRCKPNAERMMAIERAYRIPMKDWYRQARAGEAAETG